MRVISEYKPPGAFIWRGLFIGGFFCVTSLGGLIFGGAYSWMGLFSDFYGIGLHNSDN